MNPLIKKELKQCKKAQIPALSGENNVILIPKGERAVEQIVSVGSYYIIELENYIINPPNGFTLHDNWNKGVQPKEKVMQCVVEKSMGKMVYINGIGFDRVNDSYIDGTEWSGWLPTKSITVIKKLG